jgi:signal transduction histidine kinase
VTLSGESAPELPDMAAAQDAVRSGRGQYHTLATAGGDLRVYSLPVSGGPAPLVVQVARSAYFAAETVTRQLTVVAGLSAAGLLALGGAGYWLAGRAMRPVAAAFQRQRDFVSDASHELRTPLTLLRGNAEVLARHPEQRIGDNLELVEDIISETDRLGRLVSDLLTLARADAGTAQVLRQPLDLSALATELAADVTPLAAAKGLALTTEIAPGVTVAGDRDRLRQLGLILLDNAIRYTPAGTVTVRLRGDGAAAALSVEDTGVGIAPEHLPHIFERFYRTDAARSPTDGGAGLGLAIARWIAEAHGGTFIVTSTVGRGSVFTVRLPVAGHA